MNLWPINLNILWVRNFFFIGLHYGCLRQQEETGKKYNFLPFFSEKLWCGKLCPESFYCSYMDCTTSRSNKLKFLSHSRWELCLPFCSLLNIVYSKENWYGSNSIWLQNVNELFFWKLCCLCLMLDRSWNVLCRCLMHWLVFFAGLIYPQRHCGMVVGFCVSCFSIVSQDSITSILNYWE